MIKKIHITILILLFSFILPNIVFSEQREIYWETSENIASGNIGKFVVFNNNTDILGVVYSVNDTGHDLFVVSMDKSEKWKPKHLLVKNFFSNNRSGTDFSASITSDKHLIVAYRTNVNSFEIVQFEYPYNKETGKVFASVKPDNLLFDNQSILYKPYMFIDSSNNIHLFCSLNKGGELYLSYFKYNINGELLNKALIGNKLRSVSNPHIIENNKKLYLSFQAKDPEGDNVYFYSIFVSVSQDYGATWNIKKIVDNQGQNNQRPFLMIKKGIFYLVWEKEDENYINHIFYKSFLFEQNKTIKKLEISFKQSEGHFPYLIYYNRLFFIFWADNSKGRFINYFTQIIDNEVFNNQIVFSMPGRSRFLYPTMYKNKPVFFWYQEYKNNLNIYLLRTDTYVKSPKVVVKNIPNNRILNTNKITINWNLVKDSSGIEGYRVLLTQNKDEKISKNSTLIYYKEHSRKYEDLEDGVWYFKIKAYDKAGNISETSIFSFTVDTTPPMPPEFIDPQIDADGSLLNNSPIIQWDRTSDEPLKYFRVYSKLFIDSNVDLEREKEKINFSKKSKFTTENYLKFDNLDNGYLLVGLQGIDRAGNKSEVNWREYLLNDYIPVTYISRIRSRSLFNFEHVVDIYGRGFKIGGDIDQIIIDKDKKEPFDYILSSKYFSVITDRYLKQNKGIDIEDGTYYIGVHHPTRGFAFFPYPSKFAQGWIFKNANTNTFNFSKFIFLPNAYNATTIIIIFTLIFLFAVLLFVFFTIIKVVREKIYLKMMLSNLEEIKKELSNEEYKRRKVIMKKKGLGLTAKYSLLILLLVIVIVSATAITISALALRNETINLGTEMKKRASLIMTNYDLTITDIYFLEKGFTNAIDAVETVSKIDDVGFVLFRSKVDNGLIVKYGKDKKDIDVIVRDDNFEFLSSDKKREKIKELVFNEECQKDILDLKEKIPNMEKDEKIETKIYPHFDPKNLSQYYIFVKPVVLKSDKKYIGEIAIGYSFIKILNLIKKERLNLLKLTLLVILGAILISIVGAIMLATMTIRPIHKIYTHVNAISATDDYEKLKGTKYEKVIVKSHDEIGVLAQSINEMTHTLIEKAKADKQMLLGKEIQKKFIPLEPHETDYIDIYGFYEGAAGVSGDYFEYIKLNDDYYAFIICDVAGKAVPAALIMVQISTIFHTYFSNFKIGEDKIETTEIVTQINDTVAERGFPGRFAAILVMILNVKTGKAVLTNAGYTQLLVYRKKKREAEWLQLNADSGAAGVFPSFMLPNPYVQEYLFLDHGDIVFLFSDGIEESRNGKMKVNENGEEQPDEFGLDRIKAVIDKAGDRSPREIITILMDEEKIYRGDMPQYDDLTILGIKRK